MTLGPSVTPRPHLPPSRNGVTPARQGGAKGHSGDPFPVTPIRRMGRHQRRLIRRHSP